MTKTEQQTKGRVSVSPVLGVRRHLWLGNTSAVRRPVMRELPPARRIIHRICRLTPTVLHMAVAGTGVGYRAFLVLGTECMINILLLKFSALNAAVVLPDCCLRRLICYVVRVLA